MRIGLRVGCAFEADQEIGNDMLLSGIFDQIVEEGSLLVLEAALARADGIPLFY